MSKSDLRVLLCYNAPVSVYDNYTGKTRNSEDEITPDDLSETAFSDELDLFVQALLENFHSVQTAAISRDIFSTIEALRQANPDVVFNLVESVDGIAEYESYHAGLYEILQLPYTGNQPACLANCLDKDRAKRLLRSAGINVPGSFILRPGETLPADLPVRFPVIAKLLTEDASIGISENSVISTITELHNHVNYLFDSFKTSILIEEYIDGREFNIAVLGDSVLSPSEISFEGLPDGLPRIVTYEGKWMAESVYYRHTTPVCPAPVSAILKQQLQTTARAAFMALNCRDYARVDIRLNQQEIPFVIEVNPNPDLSPDAGFARAARHAGLSYPDLLKTIVGFADERRRLHPVAYCS